MSVPDLIPIERDDHHASMIGRLADGRQFFVTQPFVASGADGPGCEYLAVYLFTPDGRLDEARIDSLGPRSTLDEQAANALLDRRIRELGDLEFDSIAVRPFSVEQHGTTFGLIPRPPDEEGDDWWVILQPGDYMAFTDPWDGYYDT